MKILVVYDLPSEGFQALIEAGHELIYPKGTVMSESEMTAHLPETEALVSVFTLPLKREHIAKAKKLKIIANYGVGYNTIDVEAATEFGVAVTNTPDPVIEPTAELAMALMLAISRRINQLDKKIRKPNGLKWGIMENLGDSLEGKTLGIIGMGRIGRALARRALANNMKVVYNNRNRLDKDIEKKYNASYFALEELISESDYISLNAPLTKETKHIIGKAELSRMKKGAYIINTARGPLIDEAALAEALKNNTIAGAALDVFENEPEIHPDLLNLENVILVPHVGTATIDTRIEIGRCVSKNILNFISGEGEIDKVN